MLGRTSSEVFCDVVVLHFNVALHLSMFFIHIFLFDVIPHPSRELSPGFYTDLILSAQPIAEWFTALSFVQPFRYLLAASATALSGPFLPTGIFYLTLLHWHFTDILTCIYQGFPGSRQFFLEVCRAAYWSSKHRPGPPVCLIHSNSNPKSSCSKRFSFKFYHILAWLACGESSIYLLLTRFELSSLVQSHM